ncbi:DUF998 domain-containing protein [Kibdelosporangium phytohabitans]|uniref:DUF998 domain-containing protein n=1 Tax=Kibdelosporangium phytohabitans TaxID=860235 RepID=A0A0N7F4D9_9PSEU|nr:DUF998 domain-containing protein [Kibdelosporangium phytohabitans]ALG11159.1 hypothetical protein AOZ06_33565 [Kibdelosporangium phytohabitans]MBE1462413.1 hypothetical protein [Kibdelosporangium phytohabitans]
MAAITKWSRATGTLGLLGVAASVLLIGLLHVLPPSSEVSVVRRTISEYGLLENAWVFNLGVFALALGSLAVLATLVGRNVIRPFSVSSVLITSWSLCLMAVVVFPKNNWAIGPSVGGMIHRYASVVAFISLPVAAILAGRAAKAAWPVWLGVLSLGWFGLIIGAVLLQPFTGVNWWIAIPLGAVELGLLMTEVAAVAALAVVRTAPSPAMLERAVVAG